MVNKDNNCHLKSTDSVDNDIRYISFRLTLTPREKEIIDLVAQGYLNKQIAYNLRVGEQTIKNHLSKIFRKLGVNNRTGAVVEIIKIRSFS